MSWLLSCSTTQDEEDRGRLRRLLPHLLSCCSLEYLIPLPTFLPNLPPWDILHQILTKFYGAVPDASAIPPQLRRFSLQLLILRVKKRSLSLRSFSIAAYESPSSLVASENQGDGEGRRTTIGLVWHVQAAAIAIARIYHKRQMFHPLFFSCCYSKTASVKKTLWLRLAVHQS